MKSQTISAVQLAKEMKLPPKRVRAILRQSGRQHDGRWKFPASEKAALKEMIRNARKRATVDKAKTKGKRKPVKREKHDDAGAAVSVH